MRPMNKEQRLAERWRPPTYVLEKGNEHGVVYYAENDNGKCAAIAYRGTAARKEWHYTFRSPQQMHAHIDHWLDGVLERATSRCKRNELKRQAAEEFVNPYKVDDIFYSSWGYDQTNVDWYQVVAVGKRTLQLREIAADVVETGFMSGKTSPRPGRFTGDPKWVTIQFYVSYEGKASHSVPSPGYGGNVYKWEGQPQYASWYA